jgi:hypothetical protein
VRSLLLALSLLALTPATALAAGGLHVSVTSGERWADDHRLEATITPNGDGRGDRAVVTVRVDRPSRLVLDIVSINPHGRRRVASLHTGCVHRCRLTWTGGNQLPGSYLSLLTATDRRGRVIHLGHLDYEPGVGATAPVFRIRRVEAAAAATSYAPGDTATLRVACDRPRLTLTVLHVGPETVPTRDDHTVNGVTVLGPQQIAWGGGTRTASLRFDVGRTWPSGLYAARLQTDDGQTGSALFVVRAAFPGQARVAVVLPTNTWQAYNRADTDGDGLPDTWYATPARWEVPVHRALVPWGLPGGFRNYDLPFLHWLEHEHPGSADYLSDDDLAAADPATLAREYDLIVLGGHEEYVTAPAYTTLTRYRDLGGNLFATSSNSIFWKIVPIPGAGAIARIAPWRTLGRPEAALLGAQYLANDDGSALAPYTVHQRPGQPGWFAFDGTGLQPGETFGQVGVEIDHVAASSPRGTMILAEAPSIFGLGYTAQMTAYTTAAGAKVVDAGAFLLPRSAIGDGFVLRPTAGVLENLWRWLTAP